VGQKKLLKSSIFDSAFGARGVRAGDSPAIYCQKLAREERKLTRVGWRARHERSVKLLG
jgi:hypothetical protein